ncbi:MAG: hypothetical protein IRY95_05370, partial [Clostridia bacterium]|nr:hypothetical protein [Clostridia bacterium]
MQWPRWLWLWVLFPALSVGAFEAIRHRFFDGLPAWAGNTVAAVVAAVGSAVYYWLTLHLVWRRWRGLQ